jgi:hypothetical protein
MASSEEKIILSFLFKRSGKEMLKESEICLPLSLNLGWFTTNNAKKFVEHATQQGLLIKKNGLYMTSFDIEKVSIPIGFSPKENMFHRTESNQKTESKQTLLDILIQRISKKSEKSFEEIHNEIKQVSIEKKIIDEVAGMFIANKYGVDVKEHYKKVEDEIVKAKGE